MSHLQWDSLLQGDPSHATPGCEDVLRVGFMVASCRAPLEKKPSAGSLDVGSTSTTTGYPQAGTNVAALWAWMKFDLPHGPPLTAA